MRISDWSSDVCSSDLQGNGSYRSNEDCALPASRRHGAFMLVFGGLVMTRRSHFAPALAALALAAPGTALAQDGDPTLRDSFAIGEPGGSRSDERGVGKEGVSPCRSRWEQCH